MFILAPSMAAGVGPQVRPGELTTVFSRCSKEGDLVWVWVLFSVFCKVCRSEVRKGREGGSVPH